jgi:molybdate transport system ATP-binding protein
MLQAPAGITVVSGPSGAGKSTLLLTIAGLIRPRTGRVTLDGEVLFDDATGTFVPPHRRRVALVFQSLALFPHLTAWQNVAYGLAHLPRALRRERALGWLARTRVADLADRSPGTLSGGEAQRVALARALACEPRALLLDEPFSAMDPALRRELRTELLRLVVELDLPTLLVTHEREDAGSITSRVVELGAGRIVAGG